MRTTKGWVVHTPLGFHPVGLRPQPGQVSFLLTLSPCSSFSPARHNDPGESGPTSLRGPEPPDIFGYSWLEPDDKEFVRIRKYR